MESRYPDEAHIVIMRKPSGPRVASPKFEPVCDCLSIHRQILVRDVHSSVCSGRAGAELDEAQIVVSEPVWFNGAVLSKDPEPAEHAL